MKKLLSKFRNIRSKIVYTILLVILLCSVLLSITSYVFIDAENDSFYDLHIHTKEIKDEIELQMMSDRENLSTIAQFASKLYSYGENFDILTRSFRSVGLIENICIFMPDNTFVTKNGVVNVNSDLSFEEEAKRGEYISGRVRDISNPKREVVRSAVPVIYNGETIAVLYGILDLKTLEERYKNSISVENSQFFVFESGNGNLIINTIQYKFGNVSNLADRKYRKNFSYEKMYSDIQNGKSGFSSFVSAYSGENLYLHYSPIEIADWYIMLARPENVVFAEASTMGTTLSLAFIMIITIMVAYILLIMTNERKRTNMNLSSSSVRRLLLGINQQSEGIKDALREIAFFAKSRSAFFVDSDGEDFNYIVPSLKNKLLTGENRNFFISALMNNVCVYEDKRVFCVNIVRLSANQQLQKENPELYEFLKLNDIKDVCFSTILNNYNTTSILGVINPKKNTYVCEFLRDIMVCFSMAIFNKKHLERTEFIAVTDSLTGLSNRVEYKNDIVRFNDKNPENFSCIYVDVNELHVINNKYGHAAGDDMLKFVANTLKDVFDGGYIYRIGGDEFLVFLKNTEKDEVNKKISIFIEKIEMMNYHVSLGMSFRTKNFNTEEMVFEAEKRMYEDKAMYYQRKEQSEVLEDGEKSVEHIFTGIHEVDEALAIMSRHYRGIYCVSLDTDKGKRVLMPEYFKQFSENEDSYSKIFSNYVHDMVKPDYHRVLLNFLEYDVLKRQIADGYIPCASYTKNNDENIMLSIYPVPGYPNETIWVYEKK